MKLFYLTLGGFLFSGYLSLVKLISDTCALNEPCPFFLGYPACWYGFALFSGLLICSITNFYKIQSKRIYWTEIYLSGLGILFSSYFTLPEIVRLLQGGSFYTLGLPTCAYGLIFYIAIFVLATKKLTKLTNKIN